MPDDILNLPLGCLPGGKAAVGSADDMFEEELVSLGAGRDGVAAPNKPDFGGIPFTVGVFDGETGLAALQAGDQPGADLIVAGSSCRLCLLH